MLNCLDDHIKKDLSTEMAQLLVTFQPWLTELTRTPPGMYNTDTLMRKIIGVAFSWLPRGRSSRGGWVRVAHFNHTVSFLWTTHRDRHDSTKGNSLLLLLNDDGELLHYAESSSTDRTATIGPVWSKEKGDPVTLTKALSYGTWLNRVIVQNDLFPEEE